MLMLHLYMCFFFFVKIFLFIIYVLYATYGYRHIFSLHFSFFLLLPHDTMARRLSVLCCSAACTFTRVDILLTGCIFLLKLFSYYTCINIYIISCYWSKTTRKRHMMCFLYLGRKINYSVLVLQIYSNFLNFRTKLQHLGVLSILVQIDRINKSLAKL